MIQVVDVKVKPFITSWCFDTVCCSFLVISAVYAYAEGNIVCFSYIIKYVVQVFFNLVTLLSHYNHTASSS